MSSSKLSTVLTVIPASHRTPLLKEYSDLMNAFYEHRWRSAELSGGRFCEIVYSILKGKATGSFSNSPSKPANLCQACRDLEREMSLPRGLRVLVPRMLVALYEIRNNRDVGHVGANVSPDAMDSQIVIEMCSWILAELVREFHQSTTKDAKDLVEQISERKLSLVWVQGGNKRVADARLKLPEKILILLATANEYVKISQLLAWLKYGDKKYLKILLKKFDEDCLVDFDENTEKVRLLPSGDKKVTELVKKYKELLS